MHGHQNREENEWLGEYKTKEQALQGARDKGIFNRLTGCGLCKTTMEGGH
jgi:hypothetical protein